MNDLIDVISRNENLVVSSREVAENFGKQHKDVLETVRNLTAQNSAVKNMMIESEYISDRGRKYPEYLLTRDGFTLLVMGFTGKKAIEWKMKYIEAFNAMEKELKQVLSPTEIAMLDLIHAESPVEKDLAIKEFKRALE